MVGVTELLFILLIDVLLFIAVLLSLSRFETRILHRITTLINQHQPDEVEEPPTPIEVQRKQRNQDFDARISRFADELGITPSPITSLPDAVELHPYVHNLPHDSISVEPGMAPGDIEIAE